MLSEFIAMTIKSEERESHNLSSYHEDNKARICTKSVQESKAIKSEVKRVMVVEKDVEELCLCSAEAHTAAPLQRGSKNRADVSRPLHALHTTINIGYKLIKYYWNTLGDTACVLLSTKILATLNYRF